MTEAAPRRKAPGPGLAARLAMQPWFHRFCARMPGLRRIAKGEGEALFEIVSGFVRSQALLALVELRVLHRLAERGADTATLAQGCAMTPERMAILLQAGAALKLIRRRGDLWRLTPRGAAFLTVPGLAAMVQHHPVLYHDLSDPVAFFRGETQPELAGFWPYVFGASGAEDPELAARYSALMADSQGLVAEDTLRLVDFRGITQLMDVGGGTGAFLAAVGRAHPKIALTLFDLPAVVAGAEARLTSTGLTSTGLASADLASADLAGRVTIWPGSFRDDPLPQGADAISLIRVLYDHADETVAALLASVLAALPRGGRLIISEPMSGGLRPDPATDVYFAIYTLAMQTGRSRSAAEIAEMCRIAGFQAIKTHPGHRPYVTSAVTAQRD